MDMAGLVHLVVVLIVAGIIIGLLWWMVGSAPFIPANFKAVIQWVILALCVLFVIAEVLIPLMNGGGTTAPLLHH
jgi:hypothetical protein